MGNDTHNHFENDVFAWTIIGLIFGAVNLALWGTRTLASHTWLDQLASQRGFSCVKLPCYFNRIRSFVSTTHQSECKGG